MSVNVDMLDERVKQLVDSHLKSKRNGRLLFAGWYDRSNDRGDVNLFEIFEDFPDPGAGQLETYPFPSSADLPITGSLRLTITSPSELRDAAARSDATLAQIMSSNDMEVMYPKDTTCNEVIERLIQ